MIRAGLLFLVLAALAGPVHGQNAPPAVPPPVGLDLRQALQMALARNFRIEAAGFDPAVALAKLRSAGGKFDPVFRAAYTRDDRLQDLSGLNDTGAAFPADGTINRELYPRNVADTFDANVAGTTSWGLLYEAGVSANVLQASRDGYRDRVETFGGFTLTQPLLRGFGSDVVMAPIRIARLDVQISEWQLRKAVTDVVTETVTIYNDLWFALGNLAVERQSRDLAAQLARDNMRRAEIGVMSPLDVLQAETDVAAREERVLVAERLVLDNENFLKQLITNQVEQILGIRLQIEAPPVILAPSIKPAMEVPEAPQQRPEFRQALLEIQKRQINVVFTRNQTLPQLDLVGSLGANGFDRNLADSISRAASGSSPAWSLGAVVSLPIPNNTALGNLQAGQLEVARALVELKRLEQGMYVEADNAAGAVATARKRIDASRAARIFSEETLKAAQVRLSAGTATTFEVLQFQRDAATARISEIRAIADYNKALAEYGRTTGTTLAKLGIVLP